MSSNNTDTRHNGGTYPPYGVISDTDHGSYVVIATWIFACISILFVGVRVLLRTWKSRHIGKDNASIAIALCFAVAQSAMAQEAVKHGLGQHRDALTDQQFTAYNKAIYASDILSIFVYVWSKLSLMAVFGYLAPSRNMKFFLYSVTAFIVLWGIAGIFTTTFKCGASVSTSFREGCVDRKGYYYAYGALNIASDALILIMPVFIVWNVQLNRQRRLIALGMFWPRIFVCIAVGIQLSVGEQYLTGEDTTWNYLWPSVWDQIATHLSVITACIPFIKPFFDSLQSSLIDSGIPRNYSLANIPDIRPWRSTNKSASRKSPGATQTSSHNKAFAPKTQSEVQGGLVREEGGSTEGLTGNAIHVQRDVVVEEELDTSST